MTSAASDPGCRGHTPSHISLELLDSASTSGAYQSPCRNISRWQIETGANRGSAVKQNHSIVSPELGNFTGASFLTLELHYMRLHDIRITLHYITLQ